MMYCAVEVFVVVLFMCMMPVASNTREYIQCDASIREKYSTVELIKGQVGRDWCMATMKKYGTVIGKRWGPMPKKLRDMWTINNCEELIQFNKVMSCNQRYGWNFFNYWIKQRYKVRSQPTDGIECITSNKANTLCRLTNATVDFALSRVLNDHREFASGFVQSHGTRSTSVSPAPGYKHVPALGECDVWETRPTFVLSNDDCFNLSHYMNDVIMVWSMLVLTGRLGRDSLLINMDGIRAGGPGGGTPHRLMIPGRPDEHGPFSAYFESWFNEVAKGKDYGDKKVCFSELYFQYFPGYPWFWADWSNDNPCSFRGPSPLYQSFSLHLREMWRDRYGQDSLPPPPIDEVHVVLETREINHRKGSSNSARVIANLDPLVTALKRIKGVRLTVQSFARLPFKEQVALSHSAGVLLTMHGAGTANMFHAAVGEPNCCALVELFPDTSQGFYTIRGFGNLARHYGMHYYRYQAEDGTSTSSGTVIDVDAVVNIVSKAVDAVRTKPSCVNNATAATHGPLSDLARPLSQRVYQT